MRNSIALTLSAAGALASGCAWNHPLDVLSADASEERTCARDSHLRRCADYEVVVEMTNGARSADVEALHHVTLRGEPRDWDSDAFHVSYDDFRCSGRPWSLSVGDTTGPVTMSFVWNEAAEVHDLVMRCNGTMQTFAPSRTPTFGYSPRRGDELSIALWGDMDSTPAPEFTASATFEL